MGADWQPVYAPRNQDDPTTLRDIETAVGLVQMERPANPGVRDAFHLRRTSGAAGETGDDRGGRVEIRPSVGKSPNNNSPLPSSSMVSDAWSAIKPISAV